MAIDRALSPRSSRMADDLTLSGLLDVLDRAEELPLRHRPRPVRAVVTRPGTLRRPGRPLPTARPVPVPAARPRPVAETPAPSPAAEPVPAEAPRPGLRVRLRALVRRLALWGAGPEGANLAWGRPAAPAPHPDAPVVLTELPSTPTIQPAAPSPAAALRPAGAPRPVLPARTARPAAASRVPVVAPLARQVPAPRPAPAPGTARAGRTTAGPRASSAARSRGDPRPPPARGSPSG
ncbi:MULTISPECIES: hypothetical protein [unclassified Geodermatophilus]|uniref:hypothetical protein n=1 Tax=unclassified Geodermatophilus TaxID=2637632 RepID=UPI003EEF42A6